MSENWVPGVPERPYWLERLRGWWRRCVGLALGWLAAGIAWLWRRLTR